MVRLRRDKYESHELFLATVGDAVILSGRREHDFTGPELTLLIPHREHTLALENVIDLCDAARPGCGRCCAGRSRGCRGWWSGGVMRVASSC